MQKAMVSVVEAKKNESYDPDKAMEYYDKAYNSYCAVEQMLIKYKMTLCWSRLFGFFEVVNNWVSWIIVTVVLSLISSVIGAFL